MSVNSEILLISFDDFIGRVDISEEMDSELLTPTIDRVQRKYLPKLICKALYDQIISEKLLGYYSPENETLVDDYIVDYLVNKVWSKYILRANLRATPSGIMNFRADDWGESLTDKHRSELIKDQEETANFYELELVSFLDNNEDDYPLYDECKCKTKRPFSQQVKITAINGNGRVTRTEKQKGSIDIERLKGSQQTP